MHKRYSGTFLDGPDNRQSGRAKTKKTKKQPGGSEDSDINELLLSTVMLNEVHESGNKSPSYLYLQVCVSIFQLATLAWNLVLTVTVRTTYCSKLAFISLHSEKVFIRFHLRPLACKTIYLFRFAVFRFKKLTTPIWPGKKSIQSIRRAKNDSGMSERNHLKRIAYIWIAKRPSF